MSAGRWAPSALGIGLAVCCACAGCLEPELWLGDWPTADAGVEGQPRLVLLPPRIALPGTRLGDTTSQELVLRNLGESPLRVTGVVWADDGDGQLSCASANVPCEKLASLDQPVLIEPDAAADGGSDLPLTIRYSARRVGDTRGMLRVLCNDPWSPEASLRVDATGLDRCVTLEVPAAVQRDAGVDFGPTSVIGHREITLGLRSCGNLSVTLTELGFVEEGTSPDFVLPAPPRGMTCAPDGRRCAGPRNLVEGAPLAIPLRYAPNDEHGDGGMLQLAFAEEELGVLEVPLWGSGSTNTCPVARAEARSEGGAWSTYDAPSSPLQVEPLSRVALRCSNSSDPDGAIAVCRWSVVQAPPGSSAGDTLPAEGTEVSLAADLGGSYVVGLEVVDRAGMPSCEQHRVHVEARPRGALHVELSWATPGDDDPTDEGPGMGSDVDLHLLRVEGGDWFSRPGDCFFANRNPDWGQLIEESDDPVLARDDIDGRGPETIRIEDPSPGLYRVAVHYFDANGFGPSEAWLSVFARGELIHRAPATRLWPEDAFWDLLLISWPAAELVIIDEVSAEAPNGGGRADK